MSVTTEKGFEQPTERQKAAFFEFRRRLRAAPGDFTERQKKAEEILAGRWNISPAETGSQFGPPTPADYKPPKSPTVIEQLTQPAISLTRELVGTPVARVREMFGGELSPKERERAAKLTKPLVPITEITGFDRLDIESLPYPYKFQAAVARPVLKAVEGLTSLENALLLGVMAKAPKWLASLGSAGFAYLMGRELPEQWRAFKEAKTPAEKTEALTAGLLGLTFTGAAARHAVKSAKGAVEEGVISRQREKALPELEAAAKTAAEVTRAAEQARIPPAELEALEKAKLSQRLGKEELAAAEQPFAEIQAQTAIKKAEAARVANLETPELQLSALAEQLSRKKIGKPYESLSLAEKNQIDNLAGVEYQKRLRQIMKVLQVKNPYFRSKGARPELESEAAEVLRRQLVEEKAARQEKPVEREPERQKEPSQQPPVESPEAPPPVRPPVEDATTALRRSLQEDWEHQGVREGDFYRDATPKDVYEKTTGGEFTPEIAREFEVWRREKGTKYELGDAEVFANEKLREARTRTPSLEERQALRGKLAERFGDDKVKLEKEKPETLPPVAETGTKPVDFPESKDVPTPVERLEAPPAEKPGSVTSTNPELANLRPHELYKRAQEIYNNTPKTEGWQERLEAELRKQGYPEPIIREFVVLERFVRPDEPFGRSTATTREGRVERAVEPPPELKAKVDEIADVARRNQIAQARYNKAREELLAEIQKLGKKGVVADLSPDGSFQITIKNPQALTESAKKAIKQIEEAEINRGSYQTEMISTDLQIAVTPGAEVLKGLELKGSLADKVAETIRRKVQAKKALEAFKKVKKESEADLIDHYFIHGSAILLGRTKEGLPVNVSVRRTPSVSGFESIAPGEKVVIAKIRALDRQKVEAGVAMLEKAADRQAWNDLMIEKFGNRINLDEVWDAAQYVKNNRFIEIREIKWAVEKKGFEFIRRNLSEADNASFDALLEKIKATDVELMSRANDLGSVIFSTAKQYGHYVEFGYWTLKAMGRAGANKAAWAAKMVENLGEKIKPFLDDLWKKINQPNYKPGLEFTENDLPKFGANTVQPKVERIQSSLPDDRPQTGTAAPESASVIKRPAPFIGAYQEQLVTTLGRVDKRIEHGFRQAIDYWEAREGEGLAIINPLARSLRFKPTALRRIDQITREDGRSMWDNWHEWNVNPASRPTDLTPAEIQVLETYKKLLDLRTKTLRNAGYSRVDPLRFKRVPSFDLLDAIRSETGAVWNTLVKELARINRMPEEKVISTLRSFKLDLFDKFPTHLRVGDGKFADIVPIQATQGISALRALNRDTARLAGVARVFGENYSDTFKAIRRRLPAGFQSDFDLARDAYFGVRRLENPRSLGKRLLIGLAQPIVRTSLLARAAFYQPTQALAAARLVSGKNLFKSLTDLAKKGTRAELEAISAYAPAILDLAWQRGQRIEDFGRIAAEVGGNISLLKPAIELTDLGVAAAFRRFALSIKEKGGKLLPRERNTLEVLNFSPEQINLIDKKGFEGYKDADVLFSAVINRGRKAVTFTGLKGPERTKFQLNPLLSSLVQFQSFSIGQMQQAARVVGNLRERFEAVGQARTPEERSRAKSQLTSAANQALSFFGASLAAAESVVLMKSLINGQDLDRPEDAKRLFEDLAETGFIPFLREFSLGFADDPSKIILPVNVITEFVDAIGGRNRYRDYEGWERAAMFLERYATRPYTQTWELPKNVMVAIGLSEGNPTLKTAINHYWSMLKSEGVLKSGERQGFDEVQRAMKDVIQAVKESPYGQFSTETNRKINEALIRALNVKAARLEEHGMDFLAAEREAKNRIKSALRSRMTVEKFWNEQEGAWKLGGRMLGRDELAKKLRGERYLDALQTYDRLIQEIVDSL